MNYVECNFKEMAELVKGLKDTLNPEESRCFVDCFLINREWNSSPLLHLPHAALPLHSSSLRV